MMAMLRRDIAEVFQKNEPEIGRALSTHAASQQGKGWKGRRAAGDSYRGADRGVHGSFALSVIPNLFRGPWTQSAQAERKNGVTGKGVSVRGDLGWRGTNKKKKKIR